MEGAQEILGQVNRELAPWKCGPSRRRIYQGADQIQHDQRLTAAVGNGSVPHCIGKIDNAVEELRLAVNNVSKQWDNGLHLTSLNRTSRKPHAKEHVLGLVRVGVLEFDRHVVSSEFAARNQAFELQSPKQA
jgi:hypothetical protein